jgi:hypothetical protein
MELLVIYPLGRPHRKHGLILSPIVLGVYTDPLSSNRPPIIAGVGFRGNVFTEPFPSNGSMRRNIFIIHETVSKERSMYMFIFDKFYE